MADINYFVGKNGCGKTRLLEAINEYASCLRNKITSDFTKIKFDKQCYFAHNKCELDNFMVQDKKDYEVTDSKNPYNKRRLPLGCSDNFSKDPITQDILKIFGMHHLYFNMGYVSTNGVNKDNCIKFYKDKSKTEYLFWLDDCSAGFQSLFKIWNNIYHQSSLDVEGKIISYSVAFDEGDRHFHPSLIKDFPKYIEVIKTGIHDQLIKKGALEVSVHFFISTHSPFLIAALKNDNLRFSHKVYMLEKGETIELRGRKNTPESCSGYSSERALLPINNMLGVNLNDLTPEVFILAEESIHVLLDCFSKKIGAGCNYFRYVTRGDADTIRRGLTLMEQRKAISFFDSKIFVIFDGGLSSVSSVEKEKLEDELGNGFLYVKDDRVLELEACYPEEIVDRFILEKRLASWDRKKNKNLKFF